MFITSEQKRLLELINKGFTNIEIGEMLCYSPDTIKKRLTRLFKLFGVKNRIQLSYEYNRNNYIKEYTSYETGYIIERRILKKDYIYQ